MMGVIQTEDEKAKEEKGKDVVAALKKEIEPLLADAKPFFGGSEKMTMAEVRTVPPTALVFCRLLTLAGIGSHGALRSSSQRFGS